MMIRWMLVILIVGICGLFVLRDPEGDPWLKVSDFMPDVSAIEFQWLQFVRKVFPKQETTAQTTKVYSWRDSSGTWQLSDSPPEDQQAEMFYIDPNRNTIQGLPTNETQ